MRFAIIDMEGSTLDTFDDPSSVAAFLVGMLQDGSTAADEVGVLEYKDGQRLGPPMLAADFLTRWRTEHMQAVIARALQNVRIDSATVLNATISGPSRSWIDITIPSERADALDAVARDSRSHRFSLAA
jgi:hypothetical protein